MKYKNSIRFLKVKKIMDNPHTELQSKDYINITLSESKINWTKLYKIKLMMCQPSPNWKRFGIDEVKINHNIPAENTHSSWSYY